MEEKEIRASDDIEISHDLTPYPLPPLAHALHPPFLSTHCSSCFSPLPAGRHGLLHCSSLCSSSSLPIPPLAYGLPADLRTALRFLLLLSLSSISPTGPRILGLLTNYHRITRDPETAARIKEGAMDMLHAMGLEPAPAAQELAAGCLCLVITNAVEVVDGEGRALGIAVYGPEFSWVNHSCSPNACYRFVISPPPPSTVPPPLPPEPHPPPRIVPACRNGGNCGNDSAGLGKGYFKHGPKIMLRSIKKINKGEEVTMAYTDLLLPRGLRQAELWSKYHFRCCCRRCSASPAELVDRVLEEVFISRMGSSQPSSVDVVPSDEASRKLTDYVDDVVAMYLMDGNAEYCCEKLESILMYGLLDKKLETTEEDLELIYRLHPLHYLALNAYTTLASAYKVRASNLSFFYFEDEAHYIQAFYMSKTSAAYSLLLATASYYLFCHESSIIASVANFWASAGESLLALARNSACGSVGEARLKVSDSSSILDYKCHLCSLFDQFGASTYLSSGENIELDIDSARLPNCVGILSQEVWSFLVQGCDCLMMFENSIDFSQLGKSSNFWDFQCHLTMRQKHACTLNEVSSSASVGCSGLEMMRIFQLGVHCLHFGRFLGSICYSRCSDWDNRVRSFSQRSNADSCW